MRIKKELVIIICSFLCSLNSYADIVPQTLIINGKLDMTYPTMGKLVAQKTLFLTADNKAIRFECNFKESLWSGLTIRTDGEGAKVYLEQSINLTNRIHLQIKLGNFKLIGADQEISEEDCQNITKKLRNATQENPVQLDLGINTIQVVK